MLLLIACRVLQRMGYKKSLLDWLSLNPAMTILFRFGHDTFLQFLLATFYYLYLVSHVIFS